MFDVIARPALFPDKTIQIEEYFGRISSKETGISIARLKSTQGWNEPPQKPDFDEYTVVLGGALYLRDETGEVTVVRGGEAVLVKKGQFVQYSSPEEDGADYIAVCLPAFELSIAHRQEKE